MKKHSIKNFSRYKKAIQKKLHQKRVRVDGKLSINSIELFDTDRFQLVEEKEYVNEKELVNKYRQIIYRRYSLCDRAEREIRGWDKKIDILSFKYLTEGFLYGFDVAIQILEEFTSDELWNDLEYVSIHWDGMKSEIEVGDKSAYILYTSPKVLFKEKKRETSDSQRRNNFCYIIDGNPEVLAFKDSNPEIWIEGRSSEVTYTAKETTPCKIVINNLKVLHAISEFKEVTSITNINSSSYGLIKIDCENFLFRSREHGAFLDIENQSKGNVELGPFRFSTASFYIIVLRSNVDVNIKINNKGYDDKNYNAHLLIYNLGSNSIQVNGKLQNKSAPKNKSGICKIEVEQPEQFELTILDKNDKALEKHWSIEVLNPYENKFESKEVSLQFYESHLRVYFDRYIYKVGEKGVDISDVEDFDGWVNELDKLSKGFD